jgi:hypothetical protein
MASNFDVDKWFSKLKDDNRFSLTRRTKDGKTVFYVAKGFVLNYGLLANESEKRTVRSRLMVAFKGKPFQDKYRGYGFERFTDKTLKEFLDSQETYRGRTVVKKSTTAKKHIEALPPAPKTKEGMEAFAEKYDEICQAYKILNNMIDSVLNDANLKHGMKLDKSLLIEYGKLTSRIKSCVDVKPDADFYETMITLMATHLPKIELTNPFLKHLRTFPADLTKVQSFERSLGRGTKFTYKLKASGTAAKGGVRITKRTKRTKRNNRKK